MKKSWPTRYTAIYVTFEGQKLRGKLFKRTHKVKEVRGLYDVLLGFVYRCFNYFAFSNTMSTHFHDNIINILMLKILNETILFKREDYEIVFVFKNQKSSKSLSTQSVVCCLLKWKDVKKNLKKKLGESFLELICFIFSEFEEYYQS